MIGGRRGDGSGGGSGRRRRRGIDRISVFIIVLLSVIVLVWRLDPFVLFLFGVPNVGVGIGFALQVIQVDQIRGDVLKLNLNRFDTEMKRINDNEERKGCKGGKFD